MATKPSPPGRFSTTTGLPHRADNRSANKRAPMSAPAPGPNGTMNFTVWSGQTSAAEAGAWVTAHSSALLISVTTCFIASIRLCGLVAEVHDIGLATFEE